MVVKHPDDIELEEAKEFLHERLMSMLDGYIGKPLEPSLSREIETRTQNIISEMCHQYPIDYREIGFKPKVIISLDDQAINVDFVMEI